MDANVHVQAQESQSDWLADMYWIWYENVLIRTHVKPRLGRRRRKSNETKGTLATWLAGWLRGRRFTCKQGTRALRFTRKYGARRRSGRGGYVVRWTDCGDADLRGNRGHEHFDLQVFQKSQDVPRRWEHRFTCKHKARALRFTRVSRVPRRAECWLAVWLRGRWFTCKQRARALRFTRVSESVDPPVPGKPLEFWGAKSGNDR